MMRMILEFLKMGAVTYGGGLAMIPLLRDIAVGYAWLTDLQFTDLIAISQSTPGPIAINMATFIGIQQVGLLGAILASLAVILPGSVLATTLAKTLEHYRSHPSVEAAFKGLRAVVVGLIATAIFQISNVTVFRFGHIDLKALCLLGMTFVVVYRYKWHPLVYIIALGIIGNFF